MPFALAFVLGSAAGWAVDARVRHPPARGEVGWLPRPDNCKLQIAHSYVQPVGYDRRGRGSQPTSPRAGG